MIKNMKSPKTALYLLTHKIMMTSLSSHKKTRFFLFSKPSLSIGFLSFEQACSLLTQHTSPHIFLRMKLSTYTQNNHNFSLKNKHDICLYKNLCNNPVFASLFVYNNVKIGSFRKWNDSRLPVSLQHCEKFEV